MLGNAVGGANDVEDVDGAHRRCDKLHDDMEACAVRRRSSPMFRCLSQSIAANPRSRAPRHSPLRVEAQVWQPLRSRS